MIWWAKIAVEVRLVRSDLSLFLGGIHPLEIRTVPKRNPIPQNTPGQKRCERESAVASAACPLKLLRFHTTHGPCLVPQSLLPSKREVTAYMTAASNVLNLQLSI